MCACAPLVILTTVFEQVKDFMTADKETGTISEDGQLAQVHIQSNLLMDMLGTQSFVLRREVVLVGSIECL